MDGAKAVSRSARPTAVQTTGSGAGADAQESPAIETVSLRLATAQDAPTLLAIYAPYVRETGITFEYEVPTEEEFALGGYEVYWSLLLYFPYFGRVFPLRRESAGQLIDFVAANSPL